MNKNQERVNNLLSLLNSKLVFMKKISEYTKQQTQFIKNSDLKQLNKLIELKQKEIDKINKLDDEFTITFNELKKDFKIDDINKADISGLKNFDKIQIVIDEIRDVMYEINEVEKTNKDLIEQTQQGTKGKLKNLGNGKKMLSGYKNKPTAPPIYFDKKK